MNYHCSLLRVDNGMLCLHTMCAHGVFWWKQTATVSFKFSPPSSESYNAMSTVKGIFVISEWSGEHVNYYCSPAAGGELHHRPRRVKVKVTAWSP